MDEGVTRHCQHCGDVILVSEIAYSSKKCDHASAVSVYCSSECKAAHERWLGVVVGEVRGGPTGSS